MHSGAGSGGPLVAVLAGGRGRRMERPKALVELGGRPLIFYPLAAAAAAGLERFVVAKPGSRLPPLDAPLVVEPREPVHPLVGLIRALEHAGGRPLVALACDTPFVPAELVGALARDRRPGALAIRTDGRTHPLIARYDPDALPMTRAALDAGESLTALLDRLSPALYEERELQRFGDPARIAFNVNDPEDLAEAERLLAAGA